MNVDRPGGISRRFFLHLAGVGAAVWPLQASNGDFWNKKGPGDWSNEEIDRLITKSPWAKTVKAQYAAGYGSDTAGGPGSGTGYPGGGTGRSGGGYPGGGYPGGSGRTSGGIGIPGIGGIGIPGLGGGTRGRGNGGGSPRAGSTSPYEGVVRWESARPVIEALKSPLPEEFEGRYVICVSGVPLMGGRTVGGEDDERTERRQEQDEMDRLKSMASLQVKGRDLLEAGVAKRQIGSGSSFLFGFSKEMLHVEPHDAEIQFRAQLGKLIVKASFLPKEMLYHGELAV